MAMHDTRDTDDSAIPLGLRRFLKDRAYELSGLSLLAVITVAGLALASWSTNDPSFNHATDAVPVNLLGYGGSVLADLLAQNLGLGALPFLFIPLVWVLRLLKHTTITNLRMTLLNWVLATLSGAVLLSAFPVPEAWPLACGLGGQLGDIAGGAIGMAFTMFLKGLPRAAVEAGQGRVLAHDPQPQAAAVYRSPGDVSDHSQLGCRVRAIAVGDD